MMHLRFENLGPNICRPSTKPWPCGEEREMDTTLRADLQIPHYDIIDQMPSATR
jgi:hypothetical protein